MLASLERAREAEHRFVGDASHELRTPLTALRGNAAYLARHGADPAVLADIEAGAERLSRAARRPARARPRGRGRAAAGRAGRASPSSRAAPTRSSSSATVASRVERAGARARGRQPRPQRPQARPRARSPSPSAATDGEAFIARRRTRARARATRRDVFERFARGATRAARAPASAWRSCKAIAERHGGRVEVDGSRFTLVCQRTLKVRPYNCTTMRRLRTASTRRLLTIVAVLVAAVAGAGIAQAALTSAPEARPQAARPRRPTTPLNAPARRGRHRPHRVHQQPAPLRLAARATPPPPR